MVTSIDVNFPSSFTLISRQVQNYTAIFEKVAEKKVHATTPKGNIGYDSWHCSCRTYFCWFPLEFTNLIPWPLVPFFQICLKNRVNSKLPTTPFGIVACTFSDNLSPNSCICKGMFSSADINNNNNNKFYLSVRHFCYEANGGHYGIKRYIQ